MTTTASTSLRVSAMLAPLCGYCGMMLIDIHGAVCLLCCQRQGTSGTAAK